jgi:hypothetical protein
LKEDICKKDFMIKQLTNKVNILQEELRELDKIGQDEKYRMNIKIK